MQNIGIDCMIIMVKGNWGTVCYWGSSYDFHMKEAKVACRQLGFTRTIGFSRFGRGTGKVWLNHIRCSGSESSLASCTHSQWGSVDSRCNGHTRDVGVVCLASCLRFPLDTRSATPSKNQ